MQIYSHFAKLPNIFVTFCEVFLQKMDKTLILNEIIDKIFNGSKSDFARKLGVKPQTVSTWFARNTFDVELIFAKCEVLSAEWLLTGEGAMYKSKSPETPLESPINDLVTPLLDRIEAQARKIERLEIELAQYRSVASDG